MCIRACRRRGVSIYTELNVYVYFYIYICAQAHRHRPHSGSSVFGSDSLKKFAMRVFGKVVQETEALCANSPRAQVHPCSCF